MKLASWRQILLDSVILCNEEKDGKDRKDGKDGKDGKGLTNLTS
jgi:hypothetical protein